MLPHRSLEGPRIVLVAASTLLIELIASLGDAPLDVGVHAFVQITARTSLIWFVMAFIASPLVTLRPSAPSKWLLRNRRYLGLAMAVSHAGHLLGILTLTARHGAAFSTTIAASTAFGGTLGYLLLAAMTATSTERGVAWLGRGRWRTLHRTGMWSFWAIFFATYMGVVGRSIWASLAVVVLLGALALRVATAWRRAARRAIAPRR